jgi:Kef-type K+ transport system membrane component KefB
MKKGIKYISFYVLIVSGFSALMYWIFSVGKGLEAGRGVLVNASTNTPLEEFAHSVTGNLHRSLGLLLLQIILIIIVSRIFGWIFKKMSQPMVIGEIVAGIVLGPSLLGFYFPEISTFVFPAESLGNLQVLSQIGLVLFMFVIGMELDFKVLKNKAREALVISHTGIIIPFTLGVGLAYFIYAAHAPERIEFSSFALFIGISMSITAFPVLARIIQERGIHKTKLGPVIITYAATDDITAWCLLAAVIAVVKAGSVLSSLYTIFLAILYIFFMIKLVHPFLRRVGELYKSEKELNQPIIAIFFIVLLLSAFITEIIGIHALFGAFMAGAIMPDNMKFRALLIGKIEDVALILFLPLFFVFSGLRTEIGLLHDPALWRITGLIILVAVFGKFAGAALASRVIGQNWRDSLTIGALMNTRGLMEIVVLNIGYDLGVLNAEVFAMMVIMALVTTFMTSPLLSLIKRLFRKSEAESEKATGLAVHRLLLFFRNPQKGAVLIRLANSLTQQEDGKARVTAMHITPSKGLHHIDTDENEKENFTPVVTEARLFGQKIETMSKISNDISSDVLEIANQRDYDQLLMIREESIFEGSTLGKFLRLTSRIINPSKWVSTAMGKESLVEDNPIESNYHFILSKVKIPTGLLTGREFRKLEQLFIPLFDEKDSFLLTYLQKFSSNEGIQITLLLPPESDPTALGLPQEIQTITLAQVDAKLLAQQDLVIISIDSYDKHFHLRKEWNLETIPTLICTPGKG